MSEMKMKTLLIAAIFSIFSMSLSALAVDIGLSPSTADFTNMLKGGYAQKTVTVSTSSTSNITGHIEVRGEISEWLSFEPTNHSFVMSRENPLRFRIIVRPPTDAANGAYRGDISFVTDSLGTLQGSGSTIKAAVKLGLNAEITGNEILACQAGGFRIDDIELGRPIGISATVLNQGNVRLSPKVRVDIWDRDQKKLLVTKELILNELLPTLEETYYREISADLGVGQYWALISALDCRQSSLLTFSVVRKGEISDRGRLLGITAERFVYTRVPMQIRASFANDGERSVSAKFIGEIRQGKSVVTAIETDPVIIEPKKTGEIPFTFTPKKPGSYTVAGRVLYNEKLSFEATNEFEAVGEEVMETGRVIMYVGIYAIIMALIIYFILRIKRERRRHH